MSASFKFLPSVDVLLSAVDSDVARDVVRERCRNILDVMREKIAADELNIDSKEQALKVAVELAYQRLNTDFTPSLKPVINATGIILHTGLGRAPLSPAVQENVARVMNGYSSLEFDLDSGKRGERTDHIRNLLCELTGAEDALLVNNNAAAVFLALNTLAFGKEAIISRGQLVEIGGSFRIPDVMQKSGVIMHEVGSTNKTKLADYENAINENTAAIVVAHTSNYRVLGFTAEVELKELCDLAHKHSIPVLHDLGAGVIVDFEKLDLPHEPLVQDSIAAGADVITFSGDKVLGGPQSGLIVGQTQWLKKIHKNPIMRAVRCDKLIYAAMEETLRLYMKKDVQRPNTVLFMMTEPAESVRSRAEQVASGLSAEIQKSLNVKVEKSQGQFGSGALPLEKIASFAITLQSEAISTDEVARLLRIGDPPIVGRIQDDKVWLDMRTVTETQVSGIVSRLIDLS
jgi:L-seryl-tRNA(Ser) seleniumtransferase